MQEWKKQQKTLQLKYNVTITPIFKKKAKKKSDFKCLIQINLVIMDFKVI